MTRCKEAKVNKGDKLTIQANYDTMKHPAYVLFFLLLRATNIIRRQSSHGEMLESMALIVANFVPELATKA
jgi:hypothetical protein